MNKRAIHLVVVGLLLLTALLVACGDNTATTAPVTTTAGAATTASAATTTASATTVAVATTAPATQASKVKTGGNLRVALNADVSKLDPLLSTALVERQVFHNMFDTLVSIDDKLNIIPNLATSWTQPDPKTIVFKLRTDVKFHDGTNFDAEAVKFNIERYLNTTGSQRKSELSNIDTVTVTDPATVQFSLKAPFAPLLANLSDRAGMMVSPTAVKKLGEEFVRNPLGAGSGAFKFVEWKKDDHLTLEKNATYWKKDANGGALPYLDKVTYRPITDETARLTSLKTGDLDIVDTVPSKDVGDLRNSADLVYKEIPALAFFGFYVNNTVEPFNNTALRQALAYAIDRDAILKSVFFNIGVVSNGPIPPPSWAYDASYKPYTRDLAKAKAKLAEGGKADGLSFKMQVPSGSPQNLQEAQIIRDQLKEAGITMDIEQLEFSKILDNLDKKQFSTSLVGWSGRIDPDGNMYSHFRSDGTNNNGGYKSPKVDELLATARSATELAARKTAYQDAQKQIMDDAAYIFINHNVAIQCSTKKLQGFVLLPDSLMRFTGVWLG